MELAMATKADRGRELARFNRSNLRVINSAGPVAVGFLGLVTLLEVNSNDVGSSAGGVDGTRAFGAAIFLLCVLWLVRVLRGGIVASENGVLVRDILRSRWYAWADVTNFGVTEGVINANVLSKRCALVITDTRGPHVITSFTAPSRAPNLILDVAQSLSEIKKRESP
jgi:hypothetical protein